MPKKIQVTEGMILSASIELIRLNGIESISTRKIAQHLNCSTQPIYSTFKTVKDLETASLLKIKDLLVNNYLNADTSEDKFLQMGLGYIQFAKCEKNLFKALYASGNLIKNDASTSNRLLDTMKQGDKMGTLEDEKLRKIHRKISIFVHGLAFLIIDNDQLYSDEEIRILLIESAQAFTHWETKEDK
jgi:AcrR family transcriptional regulator